MWKYSESGSGRPLILLHGIGMSRIVWNAVIPYLRSSRRVIAFDVAGFGSTPPLPKGVIPSISNLVGALEQSIHQIGIKFPVDIAGNSLGGTMALEAAKPRNCREECPLPFLPLASGENIALRHVPYVFGALRYLATEDSLPF